MDQEQQTTNWSQSVTGIVIREKQVLLARHTYGAGKGRLIVPGGYVNVGESPQDAVVREVMEETGILVRPGEIVGIRFNQRDWYIAFLAEYISGDAVSDGKENSEVLWMDIEEALTREDVADLTKKLIECAASGNYLSQIPYDGTTKYGPYTFYGAKKM